MYHPFDKPLVKTVSSGLILMREKLAKSVSVGPPRGTERCNSWNFVESTAGVGTKIVPECRATAHRH